MGMKARPSAFIVALVAGKCTWGKCRRNAAPPPEGVEDPQLCKRHQAMYGVSLLAGWV